MARAFDIDAFRRLLPEMARVSSRARECEERLTAVTNLFRDSGSGLGMPSVEMSGGLSPVGLAAEWDGAGLPAAIREWAQALAEERRTAEMVLLDLGAPLGDAGPSRVLVVDDSPDNRDIAAAVLEAGGFEILTAANGLEGVLAAHCAQPAVVLMDIRMPVLDGFAAARLLRLSAATSHQRLVAHTAQPEYGEGRAKGPFVDVLRKPATPETLLATVRRLAVQ